MENFEQTIDIYLNKAIDIAVNILNEKQILPPYSFGVRKDGQISFVEISDTDYYVDDQSLIDSLKDFGQHILSEEDAEGFVIMYNSKINLKETEYDCITFYFKFIKDPLPLKTRIFYFPYTLIGGKPNILFGDAFASEG